MTHIFHVVLHSVLLKVGWCLCSVEPLSRVHISFLKVVPVDLQLVVRVGAQVHCSQKGMILQSDTGTAHFMLGSD